MKVTMAVTRQQPDVEQMFRRMVFNILAHNRDDHAKQHAFLMDPNGTWNLAPAYDLTPSPGPGGEHSLAVAGKGSNILLQDVISLGKSHGISRARIAEIIDATLEAVGNFEQFAQAYDVSPASVATLKKDIEKQHALMQ